MVELTNELKIAIEVALDEARMLVDAPADAVVLTIERMTLHKRGYKRS